MSFNVLLYYPYNQNFTGGPRVVINLAKVLTNRGFSPIVATQKASSLTDELCKANIRYEIIEFPEILDVYGGKTLGYSFFQKLASLRAISEYNHAIEKVCMHHNVKAIWGRGIKSILLTAKAAKQLSVPLVWDIGMEKESKGFMRFLHWIGLTTSDIVVTEGKSQPESIFKQPTYSIFRNKFKAISPGIDSERIATLKQKKPNKYTSEHEKFRIVTVATISPRKNQLMLIEAVNNLCGKYPQIQLDLIGPSADKDYLEQCKAYVEKNNLQDYINFHGWQEDIPRYMKNANVFALTSKNEGIPYVIHEAMHAKLPIVATPVGGIPDVIEHGHTGWLVKNNSKNELIKILESCLVSPEKSARLADNAEKFAAQRLSSDFWASSYVELFEKLVADS
ncbi:glycosyltransferase family 4 protein [Leptothoe kymatousa]|uniref:Glycosyltransferase family 4 protein n=1 Tax=Leptothoe kymatousa TAU-MAC 1615 TaxID=2364775 RepID=A0ABS5Y3R2_9CYAN|nr:glycosyltransferase family 4 protein [Leptothoe kymatousa]MBT9312465.1 glycosyltransferase family 4 protein [Leptothoe kymatousa TAU-MAC 1615]